MKSPRSLTLVTMFVLLASVTLVRADWFVAQNPATGLPEAVWSSSQEGDSTSVFYSFLESSGWSAPILLSGAGEEGSAPVLAFGPEGSRAVAWGTSEETGRILLRMRGPSESTWSSAIEVSDDTEPSSGPSAVFSGGHTFVSFEVSETNGSRSVKVSKIDAGSDVQRSLVSTSSSNTPVVTRLHAEGGFLWVDWIDSESSLGYSVWQDGAWSSASHERYDGGDDIDAGRGRIRDHVTTGG